MTLEITDENYQTYKKVFKILSGHTFKEALHLLTSESDPVRVLESWELKSKSLAKKGLKAGLTDLLSSLNGCPPTLFVDINKDLQAENLPTLTQLLGLIQDTVQKVLRSKKIKTTHLYYIIKEFIDDTTSAITENQRADLSKYFGEFEMRATTR